MEKAGIRGRAVSEGLGRENVSGKSVVRPRCLQPSGTTKDLLVATELSYVEELHCPQPLADRALLKRNWRNMVRLKNRYLLVEFLYPSEPVKSAKDLPDVVHYHQPSSSHLTVYFLQNQIIKNAVAELYGDWGVGAVSSTLKGLFHLADTFLIWYNGLLTWYRLIPVVYLSQATSTAIVRAPRAYYRLVWAALTYVTKLPVPISQPCVIQVVRVSGTIKKAEEEILRRAKATILRVQEATAQLENREDYVAKMVDAAKAKDHQLSQSIEVEDMDSQSDDDG